MKQFKLNQILFLIPFILFFVLTGCSNTSDIILKGYKSAPVIKTFGFKLDYLTSNIGFQVLPTRDNGFALMTGKDGTTFQIVKYNPDNKIAWNKNFRFSNDKEFEFERATTTSIRFLTSLSTFTAANVANIFFRCDKDKIFVIQKVHDDKEINTIISKTISIKDGSLISDEILLRDSSRMKNEDNSYYYCLRSRDSTKACLLLETDQRENLGEDKDEYEYTHKFKAIHIEFKDKPTITKTEEITVLSIKEDDDLESLFLTNNAEILTFRKSSNVKNDKLKLTNRSAQPNKTLAIPIENGSGDYESRCIIDLVEDNSMNGDYLLGFTTRDEAAIMRVGLIKYNFTNSTASVFGQYDIPKDPSKMIEKVMDGDELTNFNYDQLILTDNLIVIPGYSHSINVYTLSSGKENVYTLSSGKEVVSTTFGPMLYYIFNKNTGKFLGYKTFVRSEDKADFTRSVGGSTRDFEFNLVKGNKLKIIHGGLADSDADLRILERNFDLSKPESEFSEENVLMELENLEWSLGSMRTYDNRLIIPLQGYKMSPEAISKCVVDDSLLDKDPETYFHVLILDFKD